MQASRSVSLLFVSLLFAACATQQSVDLKEPKRFLGREQDVRVDAQIFAEKITSNSMINVAYEVTNERSQPIAIADVVAASDYDEETRTVTINIGSEVPGNQMVPRLLTIASGEKKGFSVGARMPSVNLGTSLQRPAPRFLRIRVNFLGDIKPFEALINIPERAINDAGLASSLFPHWVEAAESVWTNAIPITWMGADSGDFDLSRRRRRG